MVDSTLKGGYVTYNANRNKIISTHLINHNQVCYISIKITIKMEKNDMVSQMAHAKKIGEPFMAHLENLYNIP